MIRSTILRKPILTHELFVDHHRNGHAPLFMAVKVVQDTVLRYAQRRAMMDVELPGMSPPKYDGVTELWFDDVDALSRCFSDAEYVAKVRPDEESFLDLHGCDLLVTTENPVKA